MDVSECLMQGEIDRIEGYLRGDRENQCSANLLQYMRAIPMMSPHNEKDRFSIGISCPQTKLLVPGLGDIQLSSWLKSFMVIPKQLLLLARQTDSKAPLLRITPIQLNECGEIEWGLHRTFPSVSQCLYFGGGVLCRLPKVNNNSGTKPLSYNLSCLQNM